MSHVNGGDVRRTETAWSTDGGYMSNRLPCHLYSGNKEIEASRLRQIVDHPQIIIIILVELGSQNYK